MAPHHLANSAPGSVAPNAWFHEILSAESGALFRAGEQGLVLGCGPFRASATRPRNEAAFYVNDYELSDPLPWKIPSRLVTFPEIPPEELPAPPTVTWQPPERGPFDAVFAEIKRQLHAGALRKTVPALAERGELAPGSDPRAIACRVAAGAAHMHPYAYWEGENGFAGFSPEYLFRAEGKHLATMALAGTAPPEEEARLLGDAKEIAEHEIVVEALARRLAPHGTLTRGQRTTRRLGSLTHLLTLLTLETPEERDPQFWIHLLHPTPALGPEPRNQITLRQLLEWRAQLGCPPVFGAPFGFSQGTRTEMAVVLRGITWAGRHVDLTAGGGIVEQSVGEREWREFALKRASIKRLFGLPL